MRRQNLSKVFPLILSLIFEPVRPSVYGMIRFSLAALILD
jgi:hypothetical protein